MCVCVCVAESVDLAQSLDHSSTSSKSKYLCQLIIDDRTYIYWCSFIIHLDEISH